MTIKIAAPDQEQFPDLSLGEWLTNNGSVPEKLLALDKQLYGYKWWDYRFMSPFEATMHYIDTFGKQARTIYAREIDVERAEHIHTVSGKKVLDKVLNNDKNGKRALSSFWRGRQVADAIGMPYDLFIFEAMSQRMRAWQRVYLPSPNQIYQDRNVEFVSDRWEQMKASRVFYAEHHAYLAQNYQGEPLQKAYGDYLLDRSGYKVETLVEMVEADRLSLDYLQSEHQGIFEQVSASLM